MLKRSGLMMLFYINWYVTYEVTIWQSLFTSTFPVKSTRRISYKNKNDVVV